ncbi:MAG: GTPase domain-containing protein [Planctomycetaceae bacterium]|nr:GTPase domain-containing protein [Planctomycetaceae bacterium]
MHSEVAHLELLAEIDTLTRALQRWSGAAPSWQQAQVCGALIRQLLERAGTVRVRLEAPLIVATLGGTGTGKSALINALVGRELVASGRQRPTTHRPTLICRENLTPDLLGIDPAGVDLVHGDSPALSDLVLIDCPDPDTSETAEDAETNLARLRRILPHCDVLIITATQQKYRSARVAEELAAAAPGARLVFVQTHADTDDDIRNDWQAVLGDQYEPGHLYRIDSLAALADSQRGIVPRGEFGRLVDLLTGELAGTAANRIRRANFLDLIDDTLARCQERLDGSLPAIQRLAQAVSEQRTRLGARLADRVEEELLAARRGWEMRLVGRVASRWGFSPFSLVLRLFQGLGGLVSSALLFRVRSTAQLALWGVFEGARNLQQFRARRHADHTAQRALGDCWTEDELRESALVLNGYVIEAGVDRQPADASALASEAAEAGHRFAEQATTDLDALVERVADRHAGWFTRWTYEILLVAMVAFVLFRPAKNFFYDSWIASESAPVLGLDFYLVSAFWLLLWCTLLLWRFTGRLRRGLKREIRRLVGTWRGAAPAVGLFESLQAECDRAMQFHSDLAGLREQVNRLRVQLDLPNLGRRR